MKTDSVLETIGDTPLVELTSLAPEDGARVLVKIEGTNPSGSMKDRMALAMIEVAERSGRLIPGQRVIENTAGNTGTSLAMVCSVKGYPFTAVSADCFAEEKLDTMQVLGAEVVVLETPHGDVYPGIVEDSRARVFEIRDETGAYYTDQIENQHQLTGYEALGQELLEDCPKLTDFVMAVGTGGCAMGVATAFRDQNAPVRVTLVEPAESPVLTEGRVDAHDLEGVAVINPPPLVDETLYDGVRTILESEAQRYARRLAVEEGIFAGPSSGLNVAAAIEIARQRPPTSIVATIAVDTGTRYAREPIYRITHGGE